MKLINFLCQELGITLLKDISLDNTINREFIIQDFSFKDFKKEE